MTDIERIQQKLREFRDERDWLQFHNAKDMAAGIAIEAAELQEIFLWKTAAEVETVIHDKRQAIEEEIADIANYLFEMADNLEINLAAAMEAKIRKNALKYPAEQVRGNAKKYDEYHRGGPTV
jgi:dCTP diphosphatase